MDGPLGQPADPPCGQSSAGMFFDGDTRWELLPERARCPGCTATT